ncbi:MAG TPA: ABC transporter permease, partial [Longimicrobiales bacterium]|nr:ABC transporter permease [Longimicrobiales bacterium]
DAAMGRPIPFGGAQESTVYSIDGREAPEALELVDYTAVTEGYFRAMGIPLLQGRGFTTTDRHDSQPVVVVSASLAAQFPGGQALGRRMKLGHPVNTPYPWLRVVGVVPDVKRTDLIQPARPEMYVHVSQGGYTSLATSRLVVRVADGLDPARAASTIRATVAAMDPDVPVEDVRPLTDLLSDSMSRIRFTARLVMGFSALSLLITALGLYSAISYTATTRRREMALRVALGASSGKVLGSVLGETVAALAAGLLLGAVGAWLASGLLRRMVAGAAPLDLLSFLAAAGLLCGTALLAVQGPARSVFRLDPARLLSRD